MKNKLEKTKTFISKMPLLNTVENFKSMETFMPTTRKTNTHAATDLNECGLCYESFGPKDDVVYCMKNHVFHVHCFDDHTGTRDSMTSDA